MRVQITAFMALVLLAILTIPVWTGAQHFGGSTTAVVIDDTAPASTGSIWIRESDQQVFTYNDSLGKWLGEPVLLWYGKSTGAVTGFLQHPGHTNSDTTTDAESGFRANGVMRIMKVEMSATNAALSPNCTTYVYADQTLIAKFDWFHDVIYPPDSVAGGWVADSSRVVIGDNQIMSAALVASTASTVNPDAPIMRIFLREEVTP